MNHFAFERAIAVLSTLTLAGCSIATSLDGLTGGDGSDASSPTAVTAGGEDAGARCGSSCADATVSSFQPTDAGAEAGFASEDAGTSIPSNTIDASVEDSGVPDDAPSDTAAIDSSPAPSDDAGPCTPQTPASLDVCTAFGALPAPPVIDGVLECGVPLWTMPVVVASGPGPLPANVGATVAAAWRPDGLYFFVTVTGAGPDRYPAPSSEVAWCGDAVELFVDHDGVFPNAPSYNDPGTAQLVAMAPAATDQVSTSGQVFRDGALIEAWNGQFVAHATDDGFTVEAFVTAADLGLTSWTLGAGDNVGLDISVDLGSSQDPGDCARLGQFTIQLPVYTANNCGAGCNVGEFCVPELE